MPKLAIASIVGLGTAGIGGGVYLYAKSIKSVEEKGTIYLKLKRDKYIPLKSEDSNHKTYWNASLEKYRSTHSSKNSYTEDQLKDLCDGLFKKEETGKNDYETARKYCVVPTTVSSHLQNLGLSVLPTDSSKDDKKMEWTKLAEKYDTATNKITGVTTLSNEKWKNLRTKCQEIGNKKNHDDDFDSSFESFKVWCTEEGLKQLS